MLDTALQIVQEAGSLLVKKLMVPKAVQRKQTDDLINNSEYFTNIDLEVEEHIIQRIRDRYPTHSILSEGTGLTKGSSDYTWIVDPLDGTLHYIRKLPYFSTSIALQEKDQVILGVVYNPSLDELFCAQKDQGAYLGDHKLQVSETKTLSDAFIASSAFGSYKQVSQEGVFMQLLRSPAVVRIQGVPALDLCYVAAGRLDARVTAYTKPWDHSAGCLILEEAGGLVTDWEGYSWMPESQQLIATNGKIDKQLLQLVKGGTIT